MSAQETRIPCPACEGKKTIIIVATIIDGPVARKGDPVEIGCLKCNGEGTVDPVKLELERQAEEAFWCSCGNPSGDVIGYDDGEGDFCFKHHYCCRDCGKVVQVG